MPNLYGCHQALLPQEWGWPPPDIFAIFPSCQLSLPAYLVKRVGLNLAKPMEMKQKLNEKLTWFKRAWSWGGWSFSKDIFSGKKGNWVNSGCIRGKQMEYAGRCPRHVSLKETFADQRDTGPQTCLLHFISSSGYLAAGKAHGKWFVLRKVI